MHLENLSLFNFKNYEEADLKFSPVINCFVGNNGAGKTNLLDAIYYLSFCKSYFNPIDSQNIRFEAPFLVIQGNYQQLEKKDEIYCGIKKGQKKQFKKNKNEYEKLSDHIGQFPAVMISPYDSDLIHEGSTARRKFIDSIISQFDRTYLEKLIKYNKVLAQRNALLKNSAESGFFQAESIEVWDLQLVDLGKILFDKRKEFLTNFVPIFQEYYNELGQRNEEVSLEYQSHLFENDFMELLQASLHRDRMVKYTGVGIHKDDLIFKIAGHPIKKFGSQGQQKTFLIALKLAQYKYVKDVKGIAPILLLDDVFDKLDGERVTLLIQMVLKKAFGQVFLTDTNKIRCEEILKSLDVEYKLFEIQNGLIDEKRDEC